MIPRSRPLIPHDCHFSECSVPSGRQRGLSHHQPHLLSARHGPRRTSGREGGTGKKCWGDECAGSAPEMPPRIQPNLALHNTDADNRARQAPARARSSSAADRTFVTSASDAKRRTLFRHAHAPCQCTSAPSPPPVTPPSCLRGRCTTNDGPTRQHAHSGEDPSLRSGGGSNCQLPPGPGPARQCSYHPPRRYVWRKVNSRGCISPPDIPLHRNNDLQRGKK